jgi:curved DNA-binding protein CbpA
MGNQPGKPNVYQQYYDALKNNPSVPTPDVNPYEVLGVSKNFTWEELKANYRRMAGMVHPDKGGSDKLFQLVTDAFRTLAKEYQARSANVSHEERKAAARKEYIDPTESDRMRQAMEARMGATRGADEPFQERFNRLFEENKIDEDDHRGYGHLMAASSKTREDIHITPVMKKFNKDAFNEAFGKLPTKESKVVKYKEPEAMILTKNIAYTEIGGKTDDFTHQDPTAKSGLFYTDYMEAYNENNQRLIDPEKHARKEFKNVDQYDAYRVKKSARPISEREQQYIAEQKALAEQREAERLARVQNQDEMYRIQHEKLQRLMLGGR